MLKDKLFIALFALIAFIALLHILAIEFSLYWLLPWFDVFIHFLAGLWVSLMSLWIYFRSGCIKNPIQNRGRAIIVAMVSIAVISVLWEVYEIIIGIPFEADYAQDTIIDLVMGTLGALAGLIYYARVHLKNNLNDTLYDI